MRNMLSFKIIRKLIALVLAVLLSFSVFLCACSEEEGQEINPSEINVQAEGFYSTALKNYIDSGYSDYDGEKLKLDVLAATASDALLREYTVNGVAYQGIVWDEEQKTVTFRVSVPSDGLYNIGVDYYPIRGSGAKISREILIDGESPFREAESVDFVRFWKDNTQPLQDSFGDDVKPFSEEVPHFEDTLVYDADGKYGSALKFLFTAGEHELTFKFISQPMFIRSVYLSAPAAPSSYSEVSAEWKSEGKTELGETIEFEAEAFDRVTEKSDSVIGVENSGDPSASPKSVKILKMNYIGGAGFKSGNQTITWNFSVKKSGFYKLGMRVAQWYNDGLPVYRQIKIDGKVPFSEFDCYAFRYDDNWYSTVLSDDKGEPYLIWLDEGEHTISATVKMGEYAKVEETLFSATNKLSAIIRRIKMITGEEPDNNYDYEIVKNVPGIVEEFEDLKKDLVLCEQLTFSLAGKKSSMSNSFNSISEQLSELIADPDKIPKRLSDLETALGNLGDWIGSIKSMPLGIDKFWIANPDEEILNYGSNFIERTYAAIVKFAKSFVKDYQSVSTVDNGVTADTELEVWVGRGTEWCRLIKQISDAEFTPKSNAVIKVNVLPSSQIATAGVNTVLLSVAAGTAPDVVLGLGSSMPVEYAVRNAIVDVSKFEGYEATASKIYKEAFKPLSYGGGVYGLPETISFRCIYYRTDIFSDIGLSVPDTWDEFYADTLPVLYQNGLKCYIPMLYDIFLYQNGGQYYTEDGHFTALDTPEAFRAFKQTCELNINYSIPIAANYFTRFRTGEMPMIIGQAADYLTLKSAAPEISGNWDIAPIPATVTENGLNRSSCGTPVDCAVIMSQSENQQKAWEFLQFWMSDETQTRFANEIENQLGITARYFSANIAAFDSLAFTENESAVINTFLENNIESQVVLGGYYTSRHIVNAWTRCVESGEDFRNSLEEAVEDINTELKRKQEEYGVFDD